MNEIGQMIRRVRKEHGLTQQELADLSGMAQSDISRVEGPNGNPSIQILQRLAAALEMKLSIEFVKPEKEKKARKPKTVKTAD